MEVTISSIGVSGWGISATDDCKKVDPVPFFSDGADLQASIT